MELKNMKSSHWWWLESINNGDANRSSWLQSTLAELDDKTKSMIKIIEGDADSFAQRAEMYYNKRPELITLVEEFYRSHRSLAEKYDHHMKSEPITRVLTPWSSPLSFTKYRLEKSPSLLDDKTYDSYSEAYGPDESDLSEVDDPEEVEEEHKFQIHIKTRLQQVTSGATNEELIMLREEVAKLKRENHVQEMQLTQKDEEKREVIRQLSIAMDLLREENEKLRKCLARNTPKKEKQSKEGGFLGRLFDGFTKPRGNLIAI